MSKPQSELIRTAQVSPIASASLRFIGMFITDGASPLGFLKQQVTVPKGVQPPKVIMEWHDQTFRPLPKSKWSFSKITGAIRHGLPHLKDNWVDDSVPGKITCKTKSRKKVLVSVVGQEIDFKIRVWVDGRDERLDEVAYVNCDENVQKLINKGVAFAFIEVLSGEHEVIAEIVKRDGSDWGKEDERSVKWRIEECPPE